MKRMLGAMLVIPLVLGALLLGAMNLGAEVVTLTTTDGRGIRFETPLWILDDGDGLWIRAERPTSTWLRRLRQTPLIEIERRGVQTPYRAVPSPERRADVNRRMAERYGWVEWMLALIQGRESAVPIRLEALDP